MAPAFEIGLRYCAQPQFHNHRAMVARELAVAREGHNLDAVRGDFAPAENPVNSRSIFLEGFERIEGSDAFVDALACGRPCVGEEPVVGQDCVGIVGTGGGVEIAHEQDGQLGVEGGEAFTDELGAFLAGFLDLMIKMGCLLYTSDAADE